MDLVILAFSLGDVPWYGWTALVLLILFIFGDSKQWDYEVKFPMKEGIGRGEVEFEGLKRRGPIIEMRLQLDPSQTNKEIEVLLDGRSVYSMPNGSGSSRVYVNEKIDLDEPKEGQMVVVKIDSQEVFSGPLVLD